jgi:hypothetical protein
MSHAEAMAVLHRLTAERAIDGDVVAILEKDFDEIHKIRSQSQQASFVTHDGRRLAFG